MFTASEDKLHAVFLNLAQNRKESLFRKSLIVMPAGLIHLGRTTPCSYSGFAVDGRLST